VLVMISTPALSHALASIEFDPEIRINSNCSESEADLVIKLTIIKGTPIGDLPLVIEKVMSFYRDFWIGNDAVIKKILPSREKLRTDDIAPGSKAVSGVDAIVKLTLAFRDVEEKGLTAFPKDITIMSKETIPLYEECLLDGGSRNPKVKNKDSNLENRIPAYRNRNIAEQRDRKLNANSNSIAVALISFRNEFSRFPVSLEELKSSGHLLFNIINPFTNKPLSFRNENGPGTFTYSRPSEERYTLTAIGSNNLPIRRELIAKSDIPVRRLLSIKKPSGDNSEPYTKQEQTVRIYIFQMGQFLDSFYQTYNFLPRNIAFIETQGFANLNFINPFTDRSIKPSSMINMGEPGSYYYILLGEDEYILGGYGQNGRKVIEIHRDFMTNID
jgi:hypothetical protein